MNKHWISHGPTSLQHVLMTLKKQTLVLLLISYTLKFGKASHQLKHGRDQQPCTFYSTQFQRKWHDYSTFPVPATVLYCISNHPMLGTLKAQMHRPHLLAEQKKGASTRFWTMVSCTNYTSSSCTLVSAENYHVKKRKRKENTRNHPQISAAHPPPNWKGKGRVLWLSTNIPLVTSARSIMAVSVIGPCWRWAPLAQKRPHRASGISSSLASPWKDWDCSLLVSHLLVVQSHPFVRHLEG